MVRAGSLVALIVVGLATTTVAASDDSSKSPDAGSSPEIEFRPYAIQARVAFAIGARLDASARRQLLRDWQGLVRRFVGLPWNLEIVEETGLVPLESLGDSRLPSLRDGQIHEKAWVIQVQPSGGGLIVSGRAMDVATGRWGPVCTRLAPYPRDVARDLFWLSLELFTPSAEVGRTFAGGVELKVQGAALPSADPIGRVVDRGSVFRPLRLALDEDGQVIRVLDIPYTYLRVLQVDGAKARCEIRTGVRDPLTKAVLGRSRLVALGVKPNRAPTRFRFVTDTVDRRPAAGYTVTARTVPDGSPRDVGFTDRDGRLAIPAGLADGLLIVRVLAAGVEPLREFPVMPGETPDERIVPVDPMPRTVDLDMDILALRDEVVDLVAIRQRLERRMKARAEGEYWEEIPEMLADFRKLPGRDHYLQRLQALEDAAKRDEAAMKSVVLTRHARALIADTRALIERYLDDGLILGIEQALAQARRRTPGTATTSQITPGPRPEPVKPGATSPAVKPAASSEPAKGQGDRPPIPF